jgi:endonuclease/exonuclease/phosphatase family metal-dependent hydrolase
MEECIYLQINDSTYYHPYCDLKHNEIGSKSKIIERDTIKILTYNIFMRPPLIKTNDNDWKDERLQEFISHINNYDIICLQEMFDSFSSRKLKLIRAAIHAGFFFYAETKSPSFFSFAVVDGGLLILSRFPITKSVFIPFSYGVLTDALAEKGVLYTQIQIKDTKLHLFTTHLQASYLDSGEFSWELSFTTRMHQIEQVSQIASEILNKNFKKNEKILITGDFNVNALKYKSKKPDFITDEKDNGEEYLKMMMNLNKYNLTVIDSFKVKIYILILVLHWN